MALIFFIAGANNKRSMPAHKDGDIYINERTGKWTYHLKGHAGPAFETKQGAARAYVHAYIAANPKYRPLLTGKTWRHIFDMLQIAA